MTYSIVARDPETGRLGVAVQSRYFGVGSTVPWAEPGVGALATQSFVEVSYGPRGLELLRGGTSAPDALEALLAEDDGRDVRQVAMVDANGEVAVHTGARCVQAAGHVIGEGVSAQANMMERDTVWDAMLASFADTDRAGFPERLVAALRAAEGEGGDVRGRQSAALIVVDGDASLPRWERVIDVRVEDHADPLTELERLVRLRDAYRHLETGTDAAGEGDLMASAEELGRARDLAPDDDQIAFTLGSVLVGTGRIAEARTLLEQARAANPRWAVYLRRLAAAGMVPDDPAFLDALMPLDPAEDGQSSS
jgi:uncharacterized Ntn-hydrolase superfamily protein